MKYFRFTTLCAVLILCATFLISVPATAKDEPWKPEWTVHVFVALCDNVHQGIIPVSDKLGNGNDPANNLYWGARYGVYNFFRRSNDWHFIGTIKNPSESVMQRSFFKHTKADVLLVADAYRGMAIKQATIDFLDSAAAGPGELYEMEIAGLNMEFSTGGAADLVAYVGHDDLMDFKLPDYPKKYVTEDGGNDAIVLSCFSRKYFEEILLEADANPILLTNGLMAPEAYTLAAALEGWINGDSNEKIVAAAAKAYNAYQHCGELAAYKLFTDEE